MEHFQPFPTRNENFPRVELSLSSFSFPRNDISVGVHISQGWNESTPLFLSPEPCLQQPFVCTEGMETGIRRLIPLEEVASLRVTTVRFALEKQEKTDIGRRHGSKAIARRKFRPTTFWTFVSRCLFKLSREIVYQNFNTWPPVSFHVYFTRLRNAFNAV